MEQNQKKPIKITSKQLLVFTVFLAVAAVVIYGVSSGKKQSGKVQKSTLPLTEENLVNDWERSEGEKICRLGFEYGNEFYYSEFSSAEKATPELTVCNATYKIGESVITMTYELDLETHTDTYGINLAEDGLTLTAVQNGGTLLAGKYTLAGDGTVNSPSSNSAQSADGSQPEQNAAANPSAVSSAPDNGAALQSAQNPSFDWKTVYTDYIRSLGDSWQYTLIYLDGDNIPELYVQGASEADGSKIYTVYGGEIASRELGAFGNYYIQKSGLILTAGGHMGSYYDTVYCLQNGDFIKKFDGAYEVDDNTVYFDESDYKYKIGGATVSKSEYDRQKNTVFNDYYATSLDASLMNRSQILNYILYI